MVCGYYCFVVNDYILNVVSKIRYDLINVRSKWRFIEIEVCKVNFCREGRRWYVVLFIRWVVYYNVDVCCFYVNRYCMLLIVVEVCCLFCRKFVKIIVCYGDVFIIKKNKEIVFWINS